MHIVDHKIRVKYRNHNYTMWVMNVNLICVNGGGFTKNVFNQTLHFFVAFVNRKKGFSIHSHTC